MESAIYQLSMIESTAAKEKYLKNNFDQEFIDKLKKKVPALLQSEQERKRIKKEQLEAAAAAL